MEWAWNTMHDFVGGQDPREAYYPSLNQWRLACWDDGAERCNPKDSYMNFTLNFPEGTYLLSFYAYDYEKLQPGHIAARDSQEYRVFSDNGTLMTTRRISGIAFDDGVYEIFKVNAVDESCTFVVQVYNDGGHYSTKPRPPEHTINTLVSAIFVDKLGPKKVPSLSPLLIFLLIASTTMVGAIKINKR
jgi:hypothetical protein